MLKRSITGIIILLMAANLGFAQQTGQPATTNAEALAQLQEQIELLKKQQELEKAKSDLANRRFQEIMEYLPKSSIRALDNTTTFKAEKDASAETISLSYDALRELSAQISDAIQPIISGYSGIVIFNEPDFVSLAKYRMYRSESKIALANYEILARAIEQLDRDNRVADASDGIRVKSIDSISAGLNLPAIGTSYVKSVAELLSMFRSETNITQSTDTIEPTSIGTAMAYELHKRNANLKIFYPQAFIPEYDLESEGEDSLFTQMSKINAARANINDFVAACEKLPANQQNLKPVRETVAFAMVVRQQLKAVAIDEAMPSASLSVRSAAESESARIGMTELRQLLRAEKLDRFIHDKNSGSVPRVGILKLRLLASGGSRRETRNLFLGNKISYSGGAVIEMLLFDVDGSLRGSEIFSLHTGFRKMKTSER